MYFHYQYILNPSIPEYLVASSITEVINLLQAVSSGSTLIAQVDVLVCRVERIKGKTLENEQE